jgi:hypothetical protein
MSDDDDLHGRQLVLLLLFFGTVGGGLYFLGRLTQPSFLYDNPLVCAAIAGGSCYPARFLVERFEWWKRLEQPTKRTQDRRDRALRRALAEAREAAQSPRSPDDGDGKHRRPGRGRPRGWRVLSSGVGVLLILACLAIIPIGISIGRDDQRLAQTVPAQEAVVLSVEVDKWSRSHDVTIKVARPGDGAPVEIYGADELDPLPAVGDRISVIVDPDDPENVLAADADWQMHWYWYVLTVVIAVVLAGLCFAFFFG